MQRSFVKTTQAGFTLIELLVSISVFAVVMMVAVGSLVSVVDANRKSQTIKSVVNNLNFALESMSKNIRTGFHYACYDRQDGLNTTCDTGDGNDGVAFVSQTGQNVIVYVYDESGSKIMRCITPDKSEVVSSFASEVASSCQPGSDRFADMTAPEVKVTHAAFFVTGEADADNLQPRVLMTLSGHAGEKQSIQTAFTISTSATERVVDINNPNQ